MPDYPRTCRNGHVINGPEDEHIGHHRQCWECRSRTQAEANAVQVLRRSWLLETA